MKRQETNITIEEIANSFKKSFLSDPPVYTKGPCGKIIQVDKFGSACCSECGSICHFDYVKCDEDKQAEYRRELEIKNKNSEY